MSVDSIVVEYAECDLCGADDQRLLYSKVDYVTGREYHLVECRCGMAFVNPMPKTECIPSLYPADYLKDKTDLTQTYDRMMEFLPPSGGKLLDIGCGRGDFIRRAQEKGWDAQGVDLIEWDTPRDLTIRIGDFLQMDLPEGAYDAITAWALMEHVRHPSAFFAKAARLLSDRGKFIFVVPNFHAPGMRYSCTEDIPRHLWLFTPRAVTRYMEKFDLRIQSIVHDDSIYTAYPFGLVRKAFYSLWRKETRCSRYDNKSVALLRNRQIRGNVGEWLTQVFRSVAPLDLALDMIDLATGIVVAKVSKLIGNYGVIVVIAGKSG
jgi:SAM-dependent methyltransferase